MIKYERIPLRFNRWTATAPIGPSEWNGHVVAYGFTRRGARRNLERAFNEQMEREHDDTPAS